MCLQRCVCGHQSTGISRSDTSWIHFFCCSATPTVQSIICASFHVDVTTRRSHFCFLLAASSRTVALLWLVDEQLLEYLHSQFLPRQRDFLTVRLLHLIVPKFVSTLLQIFEILRIDFHDDDDSIEVHFVNGRLLPNCECLSASFLLEPLEPESVEGVRVLELTRK